VIQISDFLILRLTISSEFSIWISVFCLAFGVGLSWLLYRDSPSLKEVRKEIRYLLFGLRSLYLAIIAFLLISPFILSQDPVIEKPILIFGQDKSQSVAHLTDSMELRAYLDKRNAFLDQCSDDFEVHLYDFGESVKENPSDDLFNHRLTDMSVFFDVINDKYENRNVALLMFSSDGLYNRGQNPMYSSIMPFPVYCLALGDTSQRKDFWIGRVDHNRLAFLGNTFDVKVQIGAALLKGKRTELVIKRNGKIYQKKIINVHTQDYLEFHDFEISADEIGLLRFEVEVRSLDEEVSESNNSRYFFIEVLEGRQEVLILSASPHPDVSALKLAINGSKHFNATSMVLRSFDGNLEKYNLLILNQLPTSLKRKGKLNITNADIPKLFIIGKNTSISAFNKLKTGLNLSRFKRQFNETTASLNKEFQFFSFDKELSDKIEEYPPLISPFASYESEGDIHTLFYQKIGKVITDFPMITFYENDGNKTGIVAGEGMWRWRLYDFRLNGSTILFDELLQKIVQYLSVHEDKSRFRIEVEPSYFENSQVIINAEFYDKSYELNNSFQAEFMISKDGGETFEYGFLKYNDIYQVDLGKLIEGVYNWKASVSDGVNVFEKSGKFSIKPLQLEKNILQANHAFLYNLSHKQGGKLLYPKDLPSMADELLKEEKYKPVLHYSERMKELISFPWLFVLLLLFFSTEWFIRKWLGLN